MGVEDDSEVGESWKAPEWLDRERLKMALIPLSPEILSAGLVIVDNGIDDIVEGVATRIFWPWAKYQELTRYPGPSKKLRNLQKALSEWTDEHIDDWEGYLLLRCCADNEAGFTQTKDTIIRLMRETGSLVRFLETDRPRSVFGLPWAKQPGRRGENPRTTFLRELYCLYADLTGKSGLSNDLQGAGMRFIMDCAALVGIKVKPTDRQLILAATARAKIVSE